MAYTGEQKRAYQREWMRQRRNKAVEYLGGKCVICGTKEGLEIDHIDRSLKAHSIAALISRRWDVTVVELDKCQLLCAPHHLEKTLRERDKVAEHGTHSKYNRGCRCPLCKEGHRALAAETRAAGKKW